MYRSKLPHNHRSDLCWRHYHSFRIKAAACHDISRNNSGLRNSCYAEVANRVSILDIVNTICIGLENCAMHIHPQYYKNKDLLQFVARHLKEVSEEMPTVAYEVVKYFSLDNISAYKQYLINAYKYNPSIPRLAYDTYTKIGKLPDSCYLPDRLVWSKSWESKANIFSPVHDMAIGHYSIYLESNDVGNILGKNFKQRPNYIVSSGYGLGTAFKNKFMSNENNIMINNINELNEFTLNWWADAYHCDPRTWWYSKNSRINVMRSVNKQAESSIKKKIVVMHLRTNNYKKGDNDPLQKIRSVSPHTYKGLASMLVQHGYKVVHVTADKEPFIFDECDNLLVNSSNQEEKQWELYKDAAFVIGTPSGMAELRSLCSYNALLTNYINIPEALISKYGILAMKRFKIKSNVKIKSPKYFLRLFYDHWLLPNCDCLSNYCEIRPLKEKELISAGEQYIELIAEGSHECTLYEAFHHHEIKTEDLSIYPNINLSKETFKDIRNILNGF